MKMYCGEACADVEPHQIALMEAGGWSKSKTAPKEKAAPKPDAKQKDGSSKSGNK